MSEVMSQVDKSVIRSSKIGSNIAQSHLSRLYEVISGHYTPQFTLSVDQKYD